MGIENGGSVVMTNSWAIEGLTEQEADDFHEALREARAMTNRRDHWHLNVDTATDTDKPGELRLSSETVSRSAVDELVIGEWFHLEALGGGSWFLRVGDRCETVQVRRGLVDRIVNDTEHTEPGLFPEPPHPDTTTEVPF